MEYIISYDGYTCTRCKKEKATGNGYAVLGQMSCIQCFSDYEKELQPKIKKMVMDYFNIGVVQ